MTSLSACETNCVAHGVSTIPFHLCPKARLVINPCLANLRPVHLRGSHWFMSHIATGKLTVVSSLSASSSPVYIPIKFFNGLKKPATKAQPFYHGYLHPSMRLTYLTSLCTCGQVMALIPHSVQGLLRLKVF